MDFSASSLMAGFVFGTIGFWLLKESKKRANFYLAGIALTLMIYPYFTKGPLADWGVGIFLCFVAKELWNH